MHLPTRQMKRFPTQRPQRLPPPTPYESERSDLTSQGVPGLSPPPVCCRFESVINGHGTTLTVILIFKAQLPSAPLRTWTVMDVAGPSRLLTPIG